MYWDRPSLFRDTLMPPKKKWGAFADFVPFDFGEETNAGEEHDEVD